MPVLLKRRARFQCGVSSIGTSTLKGGASIEFEVAVSGNVSPDTGMVVNIRDIDDLMKRRVVTVLDGKILNEGVPHFRNQAVTPESIASFIWTACADAISSPTEPEHVQVWTDALHWTTCSRPKTGNTMVISSTRKYDFSASHRLHSKHLTDAENLSVFGKCNWENGHGHNYEVEVTVTGEVNPLTGVLLSERDLDEIIERKVMAPFDHKHLNYDTDDFRDVNPTSENLTIAIWNRIVKEINAIRPGLVALRTVVVKETARNYFEYSGG